MENKPKISVLAPAYQAENFIQRYIDCVLNFDYPNIELILINDGSSDKTHEIIESNRERISNAGIEFKYINLEENRGQAYAVNVGLKEVTGEYLSWHDVDDIFFPNCLTRCYEVIQEHPECKSVFCKSAVVKSDNLDKIVTYIPSKKFAFKNLFKATILGKKIIYAAMRFVETKALFDVLKDKSIDTSNGGQNLQLLLPMAYKYKWCYIDEILAKYVLYNNSHSHSIDKLKHVKQIYKIKINTLERLDMPPSEKIYYKFLVMLTFYWMFLKRVFIRININSKQKFVKIEFFGREIFNSERRNDAK